MMVLSLGEAECWERQCFGWWSARLSRRMAGPRWYHGRPSSVVSSLLMRSLTMITPQNMSTKWMQAVVLGLPLYWAPATLLVCYCSAGRVGKRGLLGQKGRFDGAVKQWWLLWWREELGLVDGSLCTEDLKRAVSAAERGERQGERELLWGEPAAECEVTEEGDALCDVWVFPHIFNEMYRKTILLLLTFWDR
jgi:hypothetical protein